MTKAIQKADDGQAEAIERVLITGDLGKLTPEQRVSYYSSVCKSVGLNHLTNPFAYIKLNGKLVLYALKGCTDQLRKVNSISIEIVDRSQIGDIYTVTARATCKGRTDEDEGSVSTKGLYGEALANQHMKALTKAKRRVTLSLVGLGMLDSTETETIPGAVTTPGPYAAAVPERSPAELAEHRKAWDAARKLATEEFAEDNKPESGDFPDIDGFEELVHAAMDGDEVRALVDEAKSVLNKPDFESLQMTASDAIDALGEL